MRRWGTTAAAAAAALLACAGGARGQEPAGEVAAVLGEAGVVRAGEAGETPLSTGAEVRAGDRLRTGADSRLHLLFRDGTFVELAAGTELVVGEYVCTPKGPLRKGVLRLLTGKILASVEALLSGSTFSVETDNAIAGVRGTRFAVFYRKDDSAPNTRVVVLSGEVGVFDRRTGREHRVPGMNWVEVAGDRVSAPQPVSEEMDNSVRSDFRSAERVSRASRGGRGPRSASREAQPAPEGPGSPEVSVRTDYISPRGLAVPPTGGITAPPGAAVPSSPGGGAAGQGLRQTQGRGEIQNLLR